MKNQVIENFNLLLIGERSFKKVVSFKILGHISNNPSTLPELSVNGLKKRNEFPRNNKQPNSYFLEQLYLTAQNEPL